jgi:hypothetical protein
LSCFQRKQAHIQLLVISQDQGYLNRVFRFPYISRPRISRQMISIYFYNVKLFLSCVDY